MSLSDECKACASSYVVVDELVRYISRLPPAGVYHGPISVSAKRGRRFVSGSSILMSRDIAADLAQNADRILSMNDGAYTDDVAIGHWIARNHCVESASEIAENIRRRRTPTTNQTFVTPHRRGLTNFVKVPPERQLPRDENYHYHFSSKRIWEMEEFHQRFFEEGVRYEASNP